MTVMSSRPVGVNIHRRELRFEGNAHDINRVLDACQKAMREIEDKRKDPAGTYVVIVHEPGDDEP